MQNAKKLYIPLQAGLELLIQIRIHQMMTWPQSSWQESVRVLLVCLIYVVASPLACEHVKPRLTRVLE